MTCNVSLRWGDYLGVALVSAQVQQPQHVDCVEVAKTSDLRMSGGVGPKRNPRVNDQFSQSNKYTAQETMPDNRFLHKLICNISAIYIQPLTPHIPDRLAPELHGARHVTRAPRAVIVHLTFVHT